MFVFCSVFLLGVGLDSKSVKKSDFLILGGVRLIKGDFFIWGGA